MNANAREIFARMLAGVPLIYVPTVPAVVDQSEDDERTSTLCKTCRIRKFSTARVITPEVPAFYRERTDQELDALVSYAVRADAACARESARYAAAHPTLRPAPPQPTAPRSLSIFDRINKLSGNYRR